MSDSVAYLVSRFPKISETFITREARELERQGVDVRFFSLKREHVDVVQPESAAFVDSAVFGRFSWALIRAQLHWIRAEPRAYVGAWWAALRGNSRSPGFLARAFIIVPIAALFAREMATTSIRHIHAHWATHPALAALVIHRLTGLPYSVTAHMHDLYDDRSMLEEKLLEAEFVVTISDYNKALLHRLYGPTIDGKVSVIHCGIELDRFTASPLRRNGTPTVLCIGTLESRKGQRDLIEAVLSLHERGYTISCVLIGDGPDRGALEQFVQDRKAGDLVEFRGWQASDRVRDALRAATVVALPSEAEGIPVALMEALATERPVVSTNVYGIPELVEDGVTGLLTEPGDVEGLAVAIARIVDDPEFAVRLAEAGRRRVEADFDIRVNATQLRNLIFRPENG